MIVLDRIPLITIQFCLPNADSVPFMKEMGQKLGKRMSGPKKVKGESVYNHAQGSSVAPLVSDLPRMGYKMVSAVHFVRTETKDPTLTESIIRFTFSRSDIADLFLREPSSQLAKNDDLVLAEFKVLAETALWELQAYSNPFFVDDKEVDGQRELRFNLRGCTPLYRSDGKRVKVYPKDAQGKACGYPKLLEPEHEVRLEGDSIFTIEPNQVAS